MHGGCDLAYYDSLASYIHLRSIIHQFNLETSHNKLLLLPQGQTPPVINTELQQLNSRNHSWKRDGCKLRIHLTILPRLLRTSERSRTRIRSRDHNKRLQRRKRVQGVPNRKTLQILLSQVPANSRSLPPLALQTHHIPHHPFLSSHPQPPHSLQSPYQLLSVPSSSFSANCTLPIPRSLPPGISHSIRNPTSPLTYLQELTHSSSLSGSNGRIYGSSNKY